MGSLRLRLLLSVSLLLIAFFGIAIGLLDRAFRDATLRAAEDRLDIQLIALLGAAEPRFDGSLELPNEFQEPRYSAPGSGLYGAVFDSHGEAVWKSRSTLSLTVPWVSDVGIGARRFARLELDDGTPLLGYALGVDWEFPDGSAKPFTFHVVESLEAFNAQMARYRRQLLVWFGGIAIGLLVSLTMLLTWLLRPLARIEDEIHAVEQGERTALSKGYPDELAGVARNLNALIVSERARGELHRRTLGDLAHSLKTPLATLRTLLRGNAGGDDVNAQLERMDELIRYQLAKPATSGRLIGAQAFEVSAELERLKTSFDKIFFDKKVQCTLRIAEDLRFRGDKSDFLELTGNIVDNAFKRCRHRVTVDARADANGAFVFTVEDDGPGFPAGDETRVLERGARLDELPDGHGIGLAIVADIARLYGGGISLGSATDGGALVTVTIPAS